MVGIIWHNLLVVGIGYSNYLFRFGVESGRWHYLEDEGK